MPFSIQEVQGAPSGADLGTLTWCMRDMLPRGDRGVRERGAVIGVIFDNSTDLNFEIWHNRAQRDSGSACAYPSLLDRSSWFGG